MVLTVFLVVLLVVVTTITLFLLHQHKGVEKRRVLKESRVYTNLRPIAIGKDHDIIMDFIDHNPKHDFYSYNISMLCQEGKCFIAKRWDAPKLTQWVVHNRNYYKVDLFPEMFKSVIELKRSTTKSTWKVHRDYAYEDPRVFVYRSEVYVICYKTKPGDHRIVMFPFLNPSQEIELIYAKRTKVEKNWMPFEYKNQLYILYSLVPFTVLLVDMATGVCRDVYTNNNPSIGKVILDKIGLGSPPVLIGDFFVAMGHIRRFTHDHQNVVYKNFLFRFHKDTFECSFPSPLLELSEKYNIEYGTTVCRITDEYYWLVFGVQDYKTNIVGASVGQLWGYIPKMNWGDFFRIPVVVISARSSTPTAIYTAGFENVKVIHNQQRQLTNTDVWRSIAQSHEPFTVVFHGDDDVEFSERWASCVGRYVYKTLLLCDNFEWMSGMHAVCLSNTMIDAGSSMTLLEAENDDDIIVKPMMPCRGSDTAYILTNEGARWLLEASSSNCNSSSLDDWTMTTPTTTTHPNPFKWVCWVDSSHPKGRQQQTGMVKSCHESL